MYFNPDYLGDLGLPKSFDASGTARTECCVDAQDNQPHLHRVYHVNSSEKPARGRCDLDDDHPITGARGSERFDHFWNLRRCQVLGLFKTFI